MSLVYYAATFVPDRDFLNSSWPFTVNCRKKKNYVNRTSRCCTLDILKIIILFFDCDAEIEISQNTAKSTIVAKNLSKIAWIDPAAMHNFSSL